MRLFGLAFSNIYFAYYIHYDIDIKCVSKTRFTLYSFSRRFIYLHDRVTGPKRRLYK